MHGFRTGAHDTVQMIQSILLDIEKIEPNA